jgi:hypothetical protein
MKAITIEARPTEVFSWQWPDGTEVTWSIERAKAACEGREPTGEVPLEAIKGTMDMNEGSKDIDDAFAMTKDLSKPLICVLSPIRHEGKLSIIIIDGWHRMRKAVLTNTPSLKFYLLGPQIEEQCRVVPAKSIFK